MTPTPCRLGMRMLESNAYMLLGMCEISTTHAVQARMPLTGSTFSSPSKQLIVDDFPAPAAQPVSAQHAPVTFECSSKQ